MSFVDSVVDGKDMSPMVILNPEYDFPSDYLDGEIEPGKELEGSVVFEAPTNFKEAKVRFAPNTFEEDVAEFTIKH